MSSCGFRGDQAILEPKPNQRLCKGRVGVYLSEPMETGIGYLAYYTSYTVNPSATLSPLIAHNLIGLEPSIAVAILYLRAFDEWKEDGS